VNGTEAGRGGRRRPRARRRARPRLHARAHTAASPPVGGGAADARTGAAVSALAAAAAAAAASGRSPSAAASRAATQACTQCGSKGPHAREHEAGLGVSPAQAHSRTQRGGPACTPPRPPSAPAPPTRAGGPAPASMPPRTASHFPRRPARRGAHLRVVGRALVQPAAAAARRAAGEPCAHALRQQGQAALAAALQARSRSQPRSAQKHVPLRRARPRRMTRAVCQRPALSVARERWHSPSLVNGQHSPSGERD
jgi:hypothetical protein